MAGVPGRCWLGCQRVGGGWGAGEMLKVVAGVPESWWCWRCGWGARELVRLEVWLGCQRVGEVGGVGGGGWGARELVVAEVPERCR
jgi:hypothetical protein